MSGVIVISDDLFAAEVLASEQPVVVYLWADWCGPCRLVSPSIEWLAQNYTDRMKVVKMPVDDSPNTVKAYKVEGVPAVRLFQNGNLLHSWEGAITKSKLIAMIDQYFPAAN